VHAKPKIITRAPNANSSFWRCQPRHLHQHSGRGEKSNCFDMFTRDVVLTAVNAAPNWLHGKSAFFLQPNRTTFGN